MKNLISKIGDPYFHICDEDMDEVFRHPNHPNTIRIIDCEGDNYIDITCEHETREAAHALCEILNGDYED
jgi:hypothetical protein